MQIVHIEDFFHPEAGYQLNSLAPLQKKQGHDVTIITGELEKIPEDLTIFFGRDNIGARDKAFEQETGVKVVRIPLFGFYSGRALFYPRIFKAVSSLKPDIVFVHGEDTLTGMMFIKLGRFLRYPLALDCHMLEMASLNRFRSAFRWFFRTFVTPTILRERIPLIRVVDSDFVEKCLAIPLDRTKFISFGTDTLQFAPDAEKRREMRDKLGLNQKAFVILYAGKLDEGKGGKFLAQVLVKKFDEARGRPIEFLVIGNSNGQYGKEVEALFASSENKIVRLPTAKFRELAQYYQAVDLALFPKQCSMSFFEAQSCGVPILFEENEINSQRCVGGNAFLFKPGDLEDVRRKISHLAQTEDAEFDSYRNSSRQYILDNFDYVPIAQQFSDVMSEAIVEWHKKKRPSFRSLAEIKLR